VDDGAAEREPPGGATALVTSTESNSATSKLNDQL